jgi:UPF0716 protein FxsA
MFLLVLLFIVLPIAELYLIIKVGGAIGVLPTLALLLADALLGAFLWRHQGRAAWRRFNEALAEGRVPARETFDGAMIILGGALLLTPGFITDIFGLLLLIPPSRAALRRLVIRLGGRRFRVAQGSMQWGEDAFARARRRPPPRRGRPGDIEGTGWEVDDEPPGPGGGTPPALPR